MDISLVLDAPEGVISIDCKWIFKKKIGADGWIEIYKAKLVIKDFKLKQVLTIKKPFY